MAKLASTTVYGDLSVSGDVNLTRDGAGVFVDGEEVFHTGNFTDNSSDWDSAYDNYIDNVSGGGNGTITLDKRGGGSISTDLSHSHDFGDLPISSGDRDNWNQAYNNYIDSVSGNGDGTLTLTQRDGGTISTSLSHSHGEYATGDDFNNSGDYSNLRARDTTAGDVGLGDVDNYSRSHYDGRYVRESGDTMDGNLTLSNSNLYMDTGAWIGISGSQSDPNIEFESSGIELTGGGVIIGSGNPDSQEGRLDVENSIYEGGNRVATRSWANGEFADSSHGHSEYYESGDSPSFSSIDVSGNINWSNGQITSDDNNTNARIIARATSNPSDDKYIFAVESSGGSSRMGVSQSHGTFIHDGLRVGDDYNDGISDANNNVYANDFITTSDRRVKSDIKPVKDILKIYEHIKYVYAFEKEGSSRREVGLIAQEVHAGNPMFTGTDPHDEYDEVLTLSAHHMASLAVGGVKELISKSEVAKSERESLSEDAERLKKEVEALKSKLDEIENKQETE